MQFDINLCSALYLIHFAHLNLGRVHFARQSSTMPGQCINNLTIKIIILTLSKIFGHCYTMPGFPTLPVTDTPLKFWPRKKNIFLEFYENISEHTKKFFKYYQMLIKSFDELLAKLRQHFTKEITNISNHLRPEVRLTMTIM